jgi:2'-5' RNA ligase
MDLITEDHKHELGCVMLNFDFPELNKIHDIIDSKDIYEDPSDSSFGLETEPHVTLLYGLHKGVSDNDVKFTLKKFIFGACKVENPSVFKNPDYDVLKYDVNYPTRGGAFLHKANTALKELPYTSDFPDYHPHMTIAYLKKGTGQRYVDALKGSSFTLLPKYAKYSKPDGSDVKLNISLFKNSF